MTYPGIIVENLALTYDGAMVFQDLNITIEPGKITALLGPSGVGKTSLLKMIAGLETPAAGSITATDGLPLASRIAYMAQQDLLYPWATALDNTMLGATLRGEPRDAARAANLLDRAGLAGRHNALPAELSGGMRQRVALARTLYEDRPVVLMDEPFSALDAITRAKIQELAAELLTGRTCLLITHDPLEACRLGHEILLLQGAPAQLRRAMALPGAPPREVSPALLETQATLLRALAA